MPSIKELRADFKKKYPNAGPFDSDMPIEYRDIGDIPNFNGNRQIYRNLIVQCIPEEKISTIDKMILWINSKVKLKIMEHFNTDNNLIDTIIKIEFDNTFYRWILIHFTN